MWPVLLGIAGWFVASFFTKPLLNFLNLRCRVHEEMILHTANIDTMTRPLGLAYVEAVMSLRSLGTKVQAMNSSASGLLRFFSFHSWIRPSRGGSWFDRAVECAA